MSLYCRRPRPAHTCSGIPLPSPSRPTRPYHRPLFRAGISPPSTVPSMTQPLYRPDRDTDRLALQALLSLPGDVDVLGPIFARLRADHSTISVLDVGCATGVAALQRFSAPDIILTGIDLSEEAVALANDSASGFAGSATFLAGDVADLT